MFQLSPKQSEEFINAAHEIAASGLLRFSSGNLSWRINDDYAAVSGSGAWLGQMTSQQISICRIKDGELLNNVKTSVETGFHLGILRHRSDVQVVLHCQSPCATAIAASRVQMNFNCIIEMPLYVGEVAVVDYFKPGSDELAQAVIHAMKDHDVSLLRNHGHVVTGLDFKDVIQRAGFFELACELLLKGLDLQALSEKDMSAIRGNKS
jgi:ribulose-5-phosphate 4-epimerase/fuculose-1-phosphate aldolase